MVRHVGVSSYIKFSQLAGPRPLILMKVREFITWGIQLYLPSSVLDLMQSLGICSHFYSKRKMGLHKWGNYKSTLRSAVWAFFISGTYAFTSSLLKHFLMFRWNLFSPRLWPLSFVLAVALVTRQAPFSAFSIRHLWTLIRSLLNLLQLLQFQLS